MGFCPLSGGSDARQLLLLAQAANQALRGETYSTGVLEVPAGATSVTVSDSRCGVGRLAVLIPLDANAAGAVWWLSAMQNGSMTFAFATAPGTCRFGWALIGAGNTTP